MITQTNLFICPHDNSPLLWPDASCSTCNRSYLLQIVNSNIAPGGRLPIYDFRPDDAYIAQDRLDLLAHLKIVEGLTHFEPGLILDMGFSFDNGSLKTANERNNKAVLRHLEHVRALAGIIGAYAKHLLLGGYAHKVNKGSSSVESSFAGYSKTYEMLSDFIRPTRSLMHNGEFVRDGMVKHHYENMVELAHILREWKAESALEFGCGTGINLILLSRCFDWDYPISFSGFDYPVARFLAACANLTIHQVGIRDLFIADGRALPLVDNSFDLVFSHYVVEQMAGFEDAALDSMIRVARKGVVLFETSKHPDLHLNQRLFMKHSGYSQRLLEVIRKRRDAECVKLWSNPQSYLYGCPNVMFVLRKREEWLGT